MKQNKPDGRCATCPRWDRWHIRIPNPEDQQKLIELCRRSGAKTKSDFLRARLLDESFKVITEDESAEEYYRKLSSITARIHKIGILYNQTVRANQQPPLGQGSTGNASTVRAVLPANNQPRATSYWANLGVSKTINAKHPCMMKLWQGLGSYQPIPIISGGP